MGFGIMVITMFQLPNTVSLLILINRSYQLPPIYRYTYLVLGYTWEIRGLETVQQLMDIKHLLFSFLWTVQPFYTSRGAANYGNFIQLHNAV